MITSDCPVGLAARMRRRIAGHACRAAAAILAAAGVFAYLRGGPAKSGAGAATTLVEPLASLRRWLNSGGVTTMPPIAGEISCPPPVQPRPATASRTKE